jgi:GNAT superfamily N-acetyltransferase
MLAPSLDDPIACEDLLRPLTRNPRVTGRVGMRGADMAGFLFGELMLFGPMDMASLYLPPQSIAMPIEGHAVAAGEDKAEVYLALYADLAAAWVASGFFVHRIAITAGDPETQEAWVTLGFGRNLTCGVRDTGPVMIGELGGIDVREATSEDIETVLTLADSLNVHHARSPMFWPYLRTTESGSREFNLNALQPGEPPYFVAYREGIPIAMQTFLRPGFTPPIVDRNRDVYLFEGVVDDAARGGGIGTSLLEHTMRWAREAGYETCTLHFAPMNPSGAPFWLRHGFIPVEYTMERRVDERIAWAGP